MNIHVWSVLCSLNIHKLCFWCGYKHFVIIKYQVWVHVMDEHSLILLCVFFGGIFKHYWRPFMMSAGIYSKLSQIVCSINIYILICWNSRCNYKSRKILWINWVLGKIQFLLRYSSLNILTFCEKLMKIITRDICKMNCILWMCV